jgi:hypothetical protein
VVVDVVDSVDEGHVLCRTQLFTAAHEQYLESVIYVIIKTTWLSGYSVRWCANGAAHRR